MSDDFGEQDSIKVKVTSATQEQRDIMEALNSSQPRYPDQGELMTMSIEDRIPELSKDNANLDKQTQLISMEQSYINLEKLIVADRFEQLGDAMDSLYVALKMVRGYLEDIVDYTIDSPFVIARQVQESLAAQAKEIAAVVDANEAVEAFIVEQEEANE